MRKLYDKLNMNNSETRIQLSRSEWLSDVKSKTVMAAGGSALLAE